MTQIARERDCERATDDAVHAITTFVKYAEVDVEAAVRSVQDGHVNSILQDASNTCGWSRVGHAASQVIVRVNDMTPTTPVGRLVVNEVLKGLCPDPGEVHYTLDRNAEIVCAGR
jgi:hypothetical protein